MNYKKNYITPLEDVSNEFNIDLKIKRDDLFPYYLGGNKARKILKIGRKAINDGYNVLVTNGGVQSNHCRCTAMFCAEHKLRCRLILHTEKQMEEVKGNYLIAKLSGAEIEFSKLSNLSKSMDQAILEEKMNGNKPFYIWGGGHNLEGSLAIYDAFLELVKQCIDWIPDYIFFASGTGTTHAGIHVGVEKLGWHTKVVGISIASEKERGIRVISNSCSELRDYLSLSQKEINDINFFSDYMCGGYEKFNNSIVEYIKIMSKQGILLDPTYSGKAYWGMSEMIRKGYVYRGAKVLFWHTGGLCNLLVSDILN